MAPFEGDSKGTRTIRCLLIRRAAYLVRIIDIFEMQHLYLRRRASGWGYPPREEGSHMRNRPVTGGVPPPPAGGEG
jgi:hypothetical protein